MRVLFLSPYPPAHDGIGNYTWTLAHAMRDAGAQIGVVVPRGGTEPLPEVLGALDGGGEAYAGLLASVAAWKPDLIHVQFAIAAFGSRTRTAMSRLDALHRELRTPVIVTLHEFTRESALLPVLGRAVYRHVASRCDHLIVHTDAARKAVADRFGVPAGKITVIPHPSARPPVVTATGSDLRIRYELGDALVMLAFGFIHVDKGLDDLVRALRLLRARDCPALDQYRLVVAGAVRPRHGPFRLFELRDRAHFRRVLAMARRSGLRDRLVVTGYVPAGEVAGWFDAADVAVLPYRRIEQSGVASLARSFGVPVLASTAGGLAEQFAGSRWAFPPRAPGRLADVIERFAAAPPAERAWPARAMRPDDLPAVAAQTLLLYESVLAATGARQP